MKLVPIQTLAFCFFQYVNRLSFFVSEQVEDCFCFSKLRLTMTEGSNYTHFFTNLLPVFHPRQVGHPPIKPKVPPRALCAA